MRKYSFFLLSLLFLVACGGSEDNVTPVPTTYEAANFNTNAVNEIARVGNLTKLTSEMQKGRTATNTVAASTLTAELQTGSPSLDAMMTTHYKTLVNGWITELAKASGKTFTPSATPTGDGGVYNANGSSKYLFDENAAELEQFIEKGIYGAALYNYAFNTIMTTNITVASVDRVLALYGAPTTFPNKDAEDKLVAKYAQRREAPDTPTGLYSQIKSNFINLQFAIKNNNTSAQTETLAALKLNWEKVLAATVINYVHTSVTTFSKSSPTDDEKSAALHAWAEAVGFLGGMYKVEGKKITDAQISNILSKMNAPLGGTPTPYTFVTGNAITAEVTDLNSVIKELQTIYGFTDAEVEGFKNNSYKK